VAVIKGLIRQGLLEFRQTMESTPKYDKHNRDQLIELLNLKNKQIDSQRSMLYQSRVSGLSLRDKLKMFLKIKRENGKLHHHVAKLNQQIAQIRAATQLKPFALKEHAPVILNAITGLYKLINKGEYTDNEIAFLILGYQKEFFYLSDIVNFRNACGWDRSRWKGDFRVCCNAGYFYSDKAGSKVYYFISHAGRERLESLLKFMYNTK